MLRLCDIFCFSPGPSGRTPFAQNSQKILAVIARLEKLEAVLHCNT
jgi:hypothetical protein